MEPAAVAAGSSDKGHGGPDQDAATQKPGWFRRRAVFVILLLPVLLLLSLAAFDDALTFVEGRIVLATPSYAKTLLVSIVPEHDLRHGARSGHQRMMCPHWDPTDWQKSADPRLRYIWDRQHPRDCSQAKYWVKTTAEEIGFGALIRGHFAGHLVGALRTDRVFVLKRDNFPYAGCANDSTWTCYFEPLTNCSYATHVWPLWNADRAVSGEWKDWENNSHRVISKSDWTGPDYFPSDGVLRNQTSAWGSFTDAEVAAAAYLYLLRLNQRTRERVEAWMKEIIPADLDPAQTIALPIRASDKCLDEYRIESGFGGESSCPKFKEYMEVAEMVREQDPRVDTVLLSSEDARFVEARHNYTAPHSRTGQRQRPWRFVVNSKDVMQGSGDRRVKNNHTMDDIFMSFYTTLQMQMRAKYFILNCRSNFHILLRTLVVDGGCGFTPRPIIICMNDQIDRLRICDGFGDHTEYDKCMESKEYALRFDAARARLRRLVAMEIDQ